MKKEVWTDPELIRILPHGSGINYSWYVGYIDPKNKYIRLENRFDHMNENGFYDRVYPFTVYLPTEKSLDALQRDFKVSVKSRSQIAQVLKEYLEDTIFYAFEDYLTHPEKY